MTFLKNRWYVIAWEHEIPADGLFSRIVLGERVLVYRTSSGEFVALADRCCHRQAPLSAGRREGDCVRCGYHGLKFDATGRCVEIPGQSRIPSKAAVRSYPTVLCNRWVMVWMGDPARADTAMLPDNFSCDHPDWRYRPGYLHYDTDYRLICDNLLDFSHLSYVHATSLGGSTEIARTAPVITALADGVRVTRRIRNTRPSPYHLRFSSFTADTPIDRWIDYDFLLPGVLLMSSGARPCGDAEDDLSRTIHLHSCQALTPETADSTHYFFQEAHRSDQGDEATTEAIYQGLLVAFEEDRQMITAQAGNLRLQPGLPMLPLPMDGALVRFRRLLAEQLAAD